MSSGVKWITRTAIFTALVIVIQAATAPMGNQFITGSLVNLVLIVSVMTCGIGSGAAVAVVSPVFAKLFGIGPLWTIIPFIAFANIVFILIWGWLGRKKIGGSDIVSYIVALVAGAVCKFGVLYLGIVKFAVPVLLNLPEGPTKVISTTFSFPQLITAAIGGVLAVLILPLLKKAIKD